MPDRLQEIRARLDAATPGPWRAVDRDDPTFLCIMAGKYPDTVWTLGTARSVPNARLIAHAPADIAWLLDEVERLRNTKVSASNPLCDGSDDD